MSDPSSEPVDHPLPEGTRSRQGTAQDRLPRLSNTFAYGSGLGGGIALAHWLMKCYATGHFVFQKPDDALLEFGLGYIFPVVHLIGRIINKLLQRLADKVGVNDP